MLESAFWGLIQGLTEFLPISSSGHLVLVPAVLGRDGPDLATSAVLHLGTLAAVLVYFRREVVSVVRFDPDGRHLLRILVIGTIPAAIIGLAFESWFERLNERPTAVAIALLLTGVALVLVARFAHGGARDVPESRTADAWWVGGIQALALIPGVSRSGVTIGAGLGRRFDPVAAARLSFLLGIPAIAGAGLLQFLEVLDAGGLRGELIVGTAVAAVAGYAAIAILLRLLARTGLAPFGVYCIVAGSLALVLV